MQARRDLLTAMKEMGRPSTAIRPPAEQMATILYSTLSFIFPCSWRAVKSIFRIGPRRYFETWMIENSRKNEKL